MVTKIYLLTYLCDSSDGSDSSDSRDSSDISDISDNSDTSESNDTCEKKKKLLQERNGINAFFTKLLSTFFGQ